MPAVAGGDNNFSDPLVGLLVVTDVSLTRHLLR